MCAMSINLTSDILALTGCRQDLTWLITLRGELDISCEDILRDGFAHAAKQSCDRVVVDAGGVTFLDCGGLRALLDASAECDAEVWLRAPSPPVVLVAELAGLGAPGTGACSGGDVRIV
jgi:anti-anti-sigma factor